MATERPGRWQLVAGVALLAVLLAASGCGSLSLGDTASDFQEGYFFTWTRVPFTKDLNNTPVPRREAGAKVIRIKEPFSGYGIAAEFNSNAIGDIARENGMTTVYFADLETFDVLGIWKHREIMVYGE